jgi:hypothetical protein
MVTDLGFDVDAPEEHTRLNSLAAAVVAGNLVIIPNAHILKTRISKQ